MEKKIIEEVGHNYPFDPDQSPYSKFEEKIFPKLLFLVAIASIAIIFSLLLIWTNLEVALFLSFLFAAFWVFLLGPIIVILMYRRRERKLGYK
jgi:predicted MFS family arabinose efflux permease